MFVPSEVAPSVVYLCKTARSEQHPIVNAMLKEEFAVEVYSQDRIDVDAAFFGNTDLLIFESEGFSLEELSLFSHLRSQYSGLLIVLHEDLDETMQVLLYEHGIDGLLEKKLKPLLMLARLRALLRCSRKRETVSLLEFDGLTIDSRTRSVSYEGEEIDFSSREFDLLLYLAQNAYSTLDRDRLYRYLFGIEYNGFDRSIDMYICRLRTKLANSTGLPHVIKTVREAVICSPLKGINPDF